MMRTFVVFSLGIIIGVVLTLAVVQATGGWYTYVTLRKSDCESMPYNAEVVPNQPNPCHFRFPRWGFGS